MKILITGAGSLIASEVCQFLNSNGHSVYGISSHHKSLKGYIEVYQGSLQGSLDGRALKEKFDLIIHCAHSVSANSEQINILGTKKWYYEFFSQGALKHIYISNLSALDPKSKDGQIRKTLETFFIQKDQIVLRTGVYFSRNGGLIKQLEDEISKSWIMAIKNFGMTRIWYTTSFTIQDVFNKTINDFDNYRCHAYNICESQYVSFWQLASFVRRTIRNSGLNIPVPFFIYSIVKKIGALFGPVFLPEKIKLELPQQGIQVGCDLARFEVAESSFDKIFNLSKTS